jgi:hypothetical protein
MSSAYPPARHRRARRPSALTNIWGAIYHARQTQDDEGVSAETDVP